ncbi:MAG: AlpA family phage regulatory protein [Burkholderiales bacterium]|nr:AlpA family phage regulatory protein [Burkholderiales bacterium]
MQVTQPIYPAGALVRVTDICRNRKRGTLGLLPINPATWYQWVKDGRVPPGRQLGPNTVAWPIEVVLAIGKGAPDAAHASSAA